MIESLETIDWRGFLGRSELPPPSVEVLDSSESQLYALQQKWAERVLRSSAINILGNVSDTSLLDEIFSVHSPRLVFHAAAVKHVPLMEEQPLAAIANNIFGTQSLVNSASAHGARVVLLSTDKAVESSSAMGASKRVAEKIVLAAGGTVLRLGNVLASRDSVVELFARQIAAGEPHQPLLLAPGLPGPQYVSDLAQSPSPAVLALAADSMSRQRVIHG